MVLLSGLAYSEAVVWVMRSARCLAVFFRGSANTLVMICPELELMNHER